MKIEAILSDKSIKAKGKVKTIANAILHKQITVEEVVKWASKVEGSDKGTCVESLELATRTNPAIADKRCLDFMVKCLSDEAPRVKWESAKVIGNICSEHSKKLDKAISSLLDNTEDAGTVVRWSAAHALSKIMALKTSRNKALVPAAQAIIKRENDTAIKKIYLAALKKLNK